MSQEKVHSHDRQPIRGVKDMVAISSGKGGVGKSTIAANLALAMAAEGLSIGLIDTDIYGPNVPGIVGLAGRPSIDPTNNRIKPGKAYGVSVISMGMLIDAAVPVIWRGPMLAKMIHQFLFQVDWGQIDIMLLDLPPGTGDVQITLTQTAPLTGAVCITTPSKLAIEDVKRGVEMFRQTDIPLLGLIENMSGFVCNSCGHHVELFGETSGQQLAAAFNVDFLGKLPLDPEVRQSADDGTPIVAQKESTDTTMAFTEIARELISRLPPGETK